MIFNGYLFWYTSILWEEKMTHGIYIDDACGFIFQNAPMVFYAFCMCFSKSTKDLGGGIYIILKYCEPILKNN